MSNPFKVRLVSVADASERVVFDVMPIMSVSGGVEYEQITPVHMPGVQQVYRYTQANNYNIVATLLSRTVEEATANQNLLHTLKSWRYPYFGRSNSGSVAETPNSKQDETDLEDATGQDANFGSMGGWFDDYAKEIGTKLSDLMEASLNQIRNSGLTSKYDEGSGGGSGEANLLGAPPPILHLFGFSDYNNVDRMQPTKNINRIPVVLQGLDYTFADDTDYISTIRGEPWPIKMEVNIMLSEAHSPRQFETFSLSEYKAGKLRSF